MSQRIADTTITLDYSRPVARGRELFGKLVPYGRIWRPCADDATTIEVSTGIKVDGQELPAGRYSVWTEPGTGAVDGDLQQDRRSLAYGIPQGEDALRLEVRPKTGSHMETMSFSGFRLFVDGRKGRTRPALGHGPFVPLSIEVP